MKQDITQGKTREIDVALTVRIKTVNWVVSWDWRRMPHKPQTNAQILPQRPVIDS